MDTDLIKLLESHGWKPDPQDTKTYLSPDGWAYSIANLERKFVSLIRPKKRQSNKPVASVGMLRLRSSRLYNPDFQDNTVC